MKKIKVLIIVLILIVAWLVWDNYRICVSHYSIQNELLPNSFDGYRVVQVSDLHNMLFGENQKRLIEKIKIENPDMIAITGDLIDAHHTNVEVAMQFVKEAVKIAPVYFVTGNHEAWTKEYEEKLLPSLEESGVVIINDEKIELERDGHTINLLGVNDPSVDLKGDLFGEAEAMIDTKIKRMQVEGFSLLLSHRPELFEVYVDNSISCVLSGHAHGGQFRIPFVGGVYAPNQGIFPKYTAGIYEDGDTQMVVSRGLGESVIPIRVNNSPELVVVELKSLKKK